MDDIRFMREALLEAEKSLKYDDVPVGCVIVKDNEIIARGYNSREKGKNATLHAEIIAISEACEKLCSWRLGACTLYVTLEPCPMCAGAIFNARISRVVYGVSNAKTGAMGSVLDFNSYPLTHKCEMLGGVCESEALLLLQDFFGKLK